VRRESLLGAAVCAVILTMAVGAVALPDALADPPEDRHDSRLHMQQPYLEATDISGESVTLSLSARLAHRGGTAENVTVETRAINAETGLVETTARLSLGTVDTGRDVPYTTNITVDRHGSYRIETDVYADGRRATTHSGTVSNLDALVPPSARSAVRFHDFGASDGGMTAITYRIDTVTENESTLNVTTYLTNTGDEPAGGVALQLRARQADANVIAAAETVTVGEIRPGRTTTVSTQLTVPDGYDYWLDGILSADGVIVGTERSVADLDPTETLSRNQTTTETGFQSSDFVRETAPEPDDAQMDSGGVAATGGSGPGFTAVTALVALVITVLTFHRRSQ
jgi:PGF-CTERM protein